jgi:hypothetical protein
MYQFLFLGHTSLNHVYAEHHHRELLAEAAREQQLTLVPASRFTWTSVFSRVRASLQTLLQMRTRVTDSEGSTSCRSQADKLQVRQPDQPATVLGRERRGQWRAIAGRRTGEDGCAEGGFRGSRPNARDRSTDRLGSYSGSCPLPRSGF